jgi:hypothetical protein
MLNVLSVCIYKKCRIVSSCRRRRLFILLFWFFFEADSEVCTRATRGLYQGGLRSLGTETQDGTSLRQLAPYYHVIP